MDGKKSLVAFRKWCRLVTHTLMPVRGLIFRRLCFGSLLLSFKKRREETKTNMSPHVSTSFVCRRGQTRKVLSICFIPQMKASETVDEVLITENTVDF